MAAHQPQAQCEIRSDIYVFNIVCAGDNRSSCQKATKERRHELNIWRCQHNIIDKLIQAP